MADGKIPVWAKKYFSEEDVARASAAIVEAEKTTAAEIVPMVVRSSSSTESVPFVLSFFLAIFFIFVIHPSSLYPRLEPWYWHLIFLAGVAGCFWLARFPCIQRFLLLTDSKIRQVDERALLEFYTSPTRHTENATGILIFVSLMERKAVVLGDAAINAKVDPKIWSEALLLLLAGLKRRKGGDAFADAIKAMTPVLQRISPPIGKNPDEIPNDVLFKD